MKSAQSLELGTPPLAVLYRFHFNWMTPFVIVVASCKLLCLCCCTRVIVYGNYHPFRVQPPSPPRRTAANASADCLLVCFPSRSMYVTTNAILKHRVTSPFTPMLAPFLCIEQCSVVNRMSCNFHVSGKRSNKTETQRFFFSAELHPLSPLYPPTKSNDQFAIYHLCWAHISQCSMSQAETEAVQWFSVFSLFPIK